MSEWTITPEDIQRAKQQSFRLPLMPALDLDVMADHADSNAPEGATHWSYYYEMPDPRASRLIMKCRIVYANVPDEIGAKIEIMGHQPPADPRSWFPIRARLTGER